MRDDETTAIPGSPAARDGENPHFLVVGIGASAGGACSPTALSTTRSTVSCSTSWTSPSAVRPKNFAGGPRCWKSRPAFLGSQNILIFGLDGRITIWNQGCERLYGYSREEALGRIAHELLGTVFPMPLAEIKAQLLRTGAWDGELSHVKRDGERITVASRWVLHRNETGEPSAILEANNDISERTRAEALRQADRRKDEFLAMLAHELRNPLAAMQSSFELLSDSGDDGESMRLARGVMDRQLKLLIRLVDDLLDIERLALGKIPLCNEQIDVATVVEAALETTRPLIEAYNHTLDVSLPAAPLYVAGDRSRLAQVLANLIHNAAKYTPPGRIELSVSAQDKAAVMRVRDNGIGIPAEVVPRIFEYFAQEAPSSESNRRGLGVGLALSRQLVELHQGTTQAESGGRGKGSEFTVRIPLAATPSVDVAAAAVAPNGPAHASITPRKVLVIDDDHDVADALAGLLRISGHATGSDFITPPPFFDMGEDTGGGAGFALPSYQRVSSHQPAATSSHTRT
jgi:PAS domain S-box-containing protein